MGQVMWCDAWLIIGDSKDERVELAPRLFQSFEIATLRKEEQDWPHSPTSREMMVCTSARQSAA